MSAVESIRGLGLGAVEGAARPGAASAGGAAPSVDFADAFTGALSRAESAERTADDLAVRFADGDASVGLHEAMIASGKASVAVRFAVTLKNRAIDAYRELMKTPI